MTGGIAHDFRNLLATIQSGLRLAERRAENPEDMRAYIAAVRNGIDRGFELTSQLLAFAKHEELDVYAAEVNDLLRSFEPFLKYGAGPDIRTRLELGPDVPRCLIDPARFDAAVLNLVVNARDSMPNGGEIRIITERFEQTNVAPDQSRPKIYARVRVKDHGCGIPPEVLHKVFDPFFTTKGGNGTGLGLSQVRNFTKLVGGQIDIASECGIGTIVDLLFPAVEPVA